MPTLAPINKDSKEPVVINGDTVEYSETAKTASAEGNVLITYQNMVLTCKRAVFHIDTKEVYSEGDVKLTQGDNYFNGERIVYNFETKTGTVLKPHVYFAPTYYGGGEKTDKVSETEYTIKRGYVTTCDKEHPHYRVQSKQLKVYLDDKVVARNITFYIWDTPIFYFPYFKVSLKDKKPAVTVIPGRSKDWGYFVLTSWRYRFNDDAKAKFHVDYREKRGFAGGANLNYDTHTMGAGILRTYYVNESGKYTWSGREGKEIDEMSENKDRYRVQLRHKWQMDPETLTVTEVNKQSDANIVKDYFRKEFQREMSTNTYVSMIRTENNYTTSFLAQKRINNYESKIEYLPQVKFQTRSLKIGQTNFYYEGSAQADNVANRSPAPSDSDFEAARIDTKNQLSYVTNIFSWLSVRPFSGTQQTWYSRDISGSRSLMRGDFFTGIDFNSRFSRIYDVKSNIFNMEINKLRHIIAPTVSYGYTHKPTVHRSKIQQFDALDSLGYVNVISPSIENKLQTKRMVGGKLEAVDLARFIVSTGYNFGFDPKRGGRLSDYGMTFEAKPYNWMRMLSNATYNPHWQRFEKFSFNIVGNPEGFDNPYLREQVYTDLTRKRWSYGAGYRWENDISSQLEGEVMFNLTPKWKITAYERFDFKRYITDSSGSTKKMINKFAEQEYRLSRDLHCWIGEFLYNVSKENGHTFMIVFRLKAFPEMPIEFEQNYKSPMFGSRMPGK